MLAGTILMASGTTGSGPETHDSIGIVGDLVAGDRQISGRILSAVVWANAGGISSTIGSRSGGAAAAVCRGAAAFKCGTGAVASAANATRAFGTNFFAAWDIPKRPAAIADCTGGLGADGLPDAVLVDGWASAGGSRANCGEAFAVLPQIEDLLRRAIECGAVIDPWNILGFRRTVQFVSGDGEQHSRSARG